MAKSISTLLVSHFKEFLTRYIILFNLQIPADKKKHVKSYFVFARFLSAKESILCILKKY